MTRPGHFLNELFKQKNTAIGSVFSECLTGLLLLTNAFNFKIQINMR